MRKVFGILLICLLIFPSTSFAKDTLYHDAPLCKMTPYKVLDKMLSRQDFFQVHIYDIRKHAISGETVYCKAGTPNHYCYITITSSDLPSGLTRLVLISMNDPNSETFDTFVKLDALIKESIGLSYEEAMRLLNQDVPSPYKEYTVSSILKEDRRIIYWFTARPSGKNSLSFYAMNGPRRIQ